MGPDQLPPTARHAKGARAPSPGAPLPIRPAPRHQTSGPDPSGVLIPPTLPSAPSVPPTPPVESPAAQDRPVATYDLLGQTIVATITAATLTGEEAADVTCEIKRRVSGQKPGGAGGARHVVLDLQSVQYMDSGCIGVFVELLTSLQNGGGRIALVNAGHNVEYLFRLTKLDRLFPICRDVMKAIEAVERAG